MAQIQYIGQWGKDYYYKDVHYNTQCFNHNLNPEINNSIAYSFSLLKEFKKRNIKKLYVRMIGYPNRLSFLLIIPIEEFRMNMREVHYDKINCDIQVCCNLKYWKEVGKIEI